MKTKGHQLLLVVVIVALILAPVLGEATKDTELKPHKALFPLDEKDYVTLIIGVLCLIVAAAGGIGGGGILVPLYIIALGFPAKNAIALSNITILGGAINNVTFASQRRHPNADRPLIAWDVLLIMEPMTIMGAVLGSIVNKLLPSLLLTISLVLILSMLAHRTMKKGLQLLKKEGGWKGLKTRGNSSGLPTTSATSSSGSGNADRTGSNNGGGSAKEGEKHALLTKDGPAKYDNSVSSSPLVKDEDAVRRIQERERHVIWWKPLLLSLCFAGMAILSIAKRQFPCGSLPYWLLVAAVIPWVLPFFLFARHNVLQNYKVKKDIGFPFPKGNVKWDPTNSVKWPSVCVIAGLMAGLFGIGGGMVKSPLLLEMGLVPTAVSGTSATMILFTSASATLSLLIFGLLPLDYGILFFFYGMACTAVGQALVAKLLIKYKKQSIVVLSIGFIITLSVFTMGIQSIRELFLDPESALHFGTLCSRGSD